MTSRSGPRPAEYVISAFTVQTCVLDIANLSSSILGLSRSAVTGLVIVRRGASTGLIRLAGRVDPLWTRVKNRDGSFFGFLGGDVGHRPRILLVRDSWLGTHDDR